MSDHEGGGAQEKLSDKTADRMAKGAKELGDMPGMPILQDPLTSSSSGAGAPKPSSAGAAGKLKKAYEAHQKTKPSEGDPDAAAPSTAGGDAERTEKGTADGKESWESALGSAIGGDAYKALAPHLTQGALGKYASQGGKAAGSAIKGLLEGNVDASDKELAAAIGAVLEGELAKAASDMMKANDGAAAKAIAGFVDDNPYVVLLAAIAGAVGWYLANSEIPNIAQKLKISEDKIIEVGAKLGRTKDLALEELSAKYSWSGGSVKATAGKKTRDGETTTSAGAEFAIQDSYKNDKGEDVKFDRVSGSGSYKNTEKDGKSKTEYGGKLGVALGDKGQHTINADGTVKSENGKTTQDYGLKGSYALGKDEAATADASLHIDDATKKANARLGYQNGGFKLGASGGYEAPNSGKAVTTGGLDASYKGENYQVGGSFMAGSDGRMNAKANGNINLSPNLKAAGSLEYDKAAGAPGSVGAFGGLRYQKGNFGAGLDAGFTQQGGRTDGQVRAGLSFSF
jgi:hypothetical protein